MVTKMELPQGVAVVTGAAGGMGSAAARQLADEVHGEDLQAGMLFPPISAIRRVTARIAEAVIREARDSGVGRPIADAQVPAAVAAAMWEPAYPAMEPARGRTDVRTAEPACA